MAFQDRLLPASFRGIPFFVQNHDVSGGRRAVTHEPVERDGSFSEDLGRKSNGYSIEGYVIGDDYFFLRDALISAMESADTGTLIHPFLGFQEVQPGGFNFREDINEGRICRFSLTFFEAGDQSAIFEFADDFNNFVTAVFAAVAQAKNAINLIVSFTGLPGYALESAKGLINGFIDAVQTGLDEVNTNAEALSRMTFRLDDFRNDVDNLIPGDVSGLAETLDSIIRDLPDVVEQDTEDNDTIATDNGQDGKKDILRKLLENAEAEEEQIQEDKESRGEDETSNRVQERINNRGINNLTKQFLTIRLAEESAGSTYATKEDAVNVRNEILRRINEQLNDVEILVDGTEQFIDDNLFQSLKDLGALVSKIIPDPNQPLGNVQTINVLNEIPALILSYNLYGNVDREQDILDRNGIKNPNFVSGELEVIVNG